MGHVRHPTYPLIIKHGNWKSSLNGGGSGKIICKCLITGGFLLTGFVFCVFSTPAFYQRCNPFPSITHSRTHTLTHSFARSLTHSSFLSPPFPPLRQLITTVGTNGPGSQQEPTQATEACYKLYSSPSARTGPNPMASSSSAARTGPNFVASSSSRTYITKNARQNVIINAR